MGRWDRAAGRGVPDPAMAGQVGTELPGISKYVWNDLGLLINTLTQFFMQGVCSLLQLILLDIWSISFFNKTEFPNET